MNVKQSIFWKGYGLFFYSLCFSMFSVVNISHNNSTTQNHIAFIKSSSLSGSNAF